MSRSVRVRVPATTANLGPGFDCLGAALSLFNEFTFQPAERFGCSVLSTYSEADGPQVSTGAKYNLAYRAFTHLFAYLGKPVPPVQLDIVMEVPLGRGLGSSATAIVGGLAAANLWLGEPLARATWLDLAVEIEGHPDNVVPAALGGCQLALPGDSLITCPIPWSPDIALVLAVPDFALSTSKARAVLPTTVPRADAIFNAARTALLVRALAEADSTWLAEALHDRLHQPYRLEFIPGAAELSEMVRAAGALGTVISGAGPSMLIFASRERLGPVMAAAAHAWPQARICHLELDHQGARYLTSPPI